jgi:2-dehydropantoate 2-reductase
MRFAVLGAGAIGAFVGARLAEGGADVVLIARGEHLDAMRRDGVRLIADGAERAVMVPATDALEAITDADVVIVALKAYSLPAIASRVGTLLRPGATTVWAQNGIPWWYFHRHGPPLDGYALESVDPGGVIAASVSVESVVGAVVYIAAELERPGVVRFVEGRRMTLGEPDGSRSARAGAISDALQAGGVRAPVAEDLRAEIWLKLLGNATFNPISALTGATLGQLGERADVRALLLECFGEIAAVAEALGVALPISLERRLEAGVAVGDHKTSMLQDLEAGKPLEHQCMTGAVIEIARALGVDVPRIEALGACVALLDARARRAPATAA